MNKISIRKETWNEDLNLINVHSDFERIVLEAIQLKKM